MLLHEQLSSEAAPDFYQACINNPIWDKRLYQVLANQHGEISPHELTYLFESHQHSFQPFRPALPYRIGLVLRTVPDRNGRNVAGRRRQRRLIRFYVQP